MGVLAEVYEMLNTCNKCGFCHTSCKTYKVDGAETKVARGRIQLIKAVADGKIKLDADYKDAINSCLLCGECAIACPSGVSGKELVMAARRDLKLKNGVKPFAKSYALNTLANPNKLERAFKLFGGIGKSILNKVDGIDYFRGVDIKGMNVAQVPFLDQVPSRILVAQPKHKVAFYVGCFLNFSLDDTAKSVVKVLTKNDCEVIIPKEQVCCGLPQYAYGDFETARGNARKTIDTFLDKKIEAIIVACGSCAAMLQKDYLKLFANDVTYLPKVKRFTSLVKEFSEYMAEIGVDESKLHSFTPVKVTYHDPCHMVRGIKVTEQPRKLLKSLPRVEYIEMFEANRCCGASGLVQAFYHEMATDITRQKAKNIEDSGVEVVATSCPACIMRLQGGINMVGQKQKVMHVADLIARAYED
ncbi:(Fe-S)-binding protein [Desulfitobacterium chlororespirans]|uniref:Glycolate oxidase iron-sulfur subunit n=1 Tax=Desulfitobacterium chlororespirans DSM 11544 TaxID=1121395 RepID=A0A1M7UVA2_9FIRM|nr:(Fe-S)-binding protein [Desulfitobacterium chlororespirans]SHN86913.1 glycolate oxidase iron-sulfur subunit [Desulfitobacterium chlororespirans DSM 11544]